jgi:nitroreductase
MNQTIDVILNRKSIRAYTEQEISPEIKNAILEATLRAPTAGNMMLYSIIEVVNQDIKNRLVETCDHQPFIAKAPWVLLFLADYQRWFDYFMLSEVDAFCAAMGEAPRIPEEGDLLLACCDALIAAQTTVISAESLGIGSCYIGDILENYEIHRELFDLPKYALPVCLLCLGYPTQDQNARKMTSRFSKASIVFQNEYRRLSRTEFDGLFKGPYAERFNARTDKEMIKNIGQWMYSRKLGADFSREMSRSVRAMLDSWTSGEG